MNAECKYIYIYVYRFEEAPCNLQLQLQLQLATATCNLQLAACNLQLAACSCNLWKLFFATCNCRAEIARVCVCDLLWACRIRGVTIAASSTSLKNLSQRQYWNCLCLGSPARVACLRLLKFRFPCGGAGGNRNCIYIYIYVYICVCVCVCVCVCEFM